MLATLLCIALPLGALQEGPTDSPRVLVLAVPDADSDAGLSEDAARQLASHLTKQGHAVINAEQAARLAQRGQGLLASLLPEGELPQNQRLPMQTMADVVVEVKAQTLDRAKKQGRYIVETRLIVEMVSADDARSLMQKELTASGRSFDGYPPASRQAIEALTGGENGGELGPLIENHLASAAAEEREGGPRYTVVILTDREDLELIAGFATALEGLEKLVPDSLTAVRSDSVPGPGGSNRTYSEYRLRFRGRVHELRESLFGIVQERSSALEAETGMMLNASFLTSRRRLEMLVTSRAPEASVAKEFERLTESVVGELFRVNESFISGKKVAVLATRLPGGRDRRSAIDDFARAFDRERTRLQEQQEGPLGRNPLDAGPVAIQGKEFDNLRAARDWIDELTSDYFASEAGQLAMSIKRMAQQAIQKIAGSEIEILPDELEQTAAIDLIKSEAALYQEEGAVEADSIAFLTRSGAEAAVLSSLEPILQSYQFQVALIDLNSGVTVRHYQYVSDRLKAELDAQLR